MLTRIIPLAFLLACGSMPVWAGETVPADCAAYVPFGLPVSTGHHPTTLACRIGYLAQVDGSTLQPDWVAWTLNAERAMGCTPRTNPFHYDDKLPSGFLATPGDYAKSGYDLGHLASAMDDAVSPEMLADSFDVPTNFSPQLPKLNRTLFEEIEQETRSWTMTQGDLVVIDGPIFSSPSPVKIGPHHVTVPDAFFKIIIARNSKQAVAFITSNADHPKKPIAPFVVAIADVEHATGLTIPVPDGVDKVHVRLPWPDNSSAFAAAKKAACAAKH